MAGYGFYFTDAESSNVYAEHAATFKLDKAFDGQKKDKHNARVFSDENPFMG